MIVNYETPKVLHEERLKPWYGKPESRRQIMGMPDRRVNPLRLLSLVVRLLPSLLVPN